MSNTSSPTNTGGTEGSKKPSEPTPDNKPKAKRGRPPKPKEALRPYSVKVNFDHDSIMVIDELVARTGKSRSTVVYELVLNGSIKEPLTKEQTSELRKLAGMSNNLNQLGHEAHVNYSDDLAQRNYDIADKIDAVVEKLSNL